MFGGRTPPPETTVTSIPATIPVVEVTVRFLSPEVNTVLTFSTLDGAQVPSLNVDRENSCPLFEEFVVLNLYLFPTYKVKSGVICADPTPVLIKYLNSSDATVLIVAVVEVPILIITSELEKPESTYLHVREVIAPPDSVFA